MNIADTNDRSARKGRSTVSRGPAARMKIEVGAARERGSGCATNTARFMLLEHASVYMLACGAGHASRAADDAKQVLDSVHRGFADVHAGPHVDDPGSQLDAVTRFYSGALFANHVLRKACQADEQSGVSFIGIAIRGPNLCVAQSGGARAYCLRDDGFEQLVDASWAVRGAPTPALGLTPRGAVEPFRATWKPGTIVLLTSDDVAGTLKPDSIARTLLEAGNLDQAAGQLVERMNEAREQDGAAVVLMRWSSDGDLRSP